MVMVVKTLIKGKLNRSISYTHCFNNQIHLIIVHIVKNISKVKQFSNYCQVIHKIYVHLSSNPTTDRRITLIA